MPNGVSVSMALLTQVVRFVILTRSGAKGVIKQAVPKAVLALGAEFRVRVRVIGVVVCTIPPPNVDSSVWSVFFDCSGGVEPHHPLQDVDRSSDPCLVAGDFNMHHDCAFSVFILWAPAGAGSQVHSRATSLRTESW